MDNSKEVGYLWLKKRNVGRTLEFCRNCISDLNNGESIGIICGSEDFPKRCIEIFKNTFYLEVKYEPIKELRPKNNRKLHFDEWGEPTWCEILPQTLETVGYKIFKQ